MSQAPHHSWHADAPWQPADVDCPGLLIVNAGRLVLDPGGRIGPRVMGLYCILAVQKGSGTLIWRNRSLPLSAGTAFTVSPHIPHAWTAGPGESMSMSYVAFTGQDAPGVVRSLGMSLEEPRLFSPDLADPLSDTFHAIGLELQAAGCEDPAGRLVHLWRCRSMLWKALALLLNERKGTQSIPLFRSELVARVLALMESEYAHAWTVKRLAQAVHVSPSQLHAVFKKEVGKSPHAYLNEIRIRRAANLLMVTGLSVAHVAGLVGIHDPAYFSRLFRKTMGQAPSAFRQSWPRAKAVDVYH